MTFLNPLILLGLIAAAIPLVIHLFNFRRPRKIDFSSLAFLHELQKTTMQRVRIQQWLLLLLRTLAIVCLVLAFARPTLKGGLGSAVGGRASTSVAVVIDNSFSMSLRDEQGEYLAQARELAAGILDQMEGQDEAFILTTSSNERAEPAPASTRSAALDALNDIAPHPGSGTAKAALSRASEWLEEARHPVREIYFISDLQKSTLLDSLAGPFDPEVRTFMVPVGNRTYENVAVTSVEVVSRIIEEGQPARIQATLTNYGREPIEDYVAGVYLENERVAQATADLEPGASTTVEFSLIPNRRGWLSGLVQIEDDAYEHDNVRYFTLHVPEQRRLLLVQGEGQNVEHLNLAFSPRLTEGRQLFEIDRITERELSTRTFGAYDALILAGPLSFSSGEIASLARYVEEGGGLLLFPNQNADVQGYNGFLSALGSGQVTGFSGSAGGEQVVAGLGRVDYEHPLFEGIFDRRPGDDREYRLEPVSVHLAMNYSAGSGNEQTLIELSNGFPFLQEIRHGNGVVFLATVAPDLNWSDLPVRGLFIPLIYRSVYYLSSTESVQGEQLTVGRGGELRLASTGERSTVRLVSPLGEEFTPEQRDLPGSVLLQLDGSLITAGVYDVLSGERLIRRIALNVDSRESDLSRYSGREAADLLSQALGAEIRLIGGAGSDPEEVARTVREQRSGTELWNVFLALALIFLVVEMLAGKKWRPETIPA